MIKKVLAYIFIVFGLVLLWASTSRTAMQYITDKRDADTWWGTYQGRHGDLVSMSYLDFIDRFKPPVYAYPKAASGGKEKNMIVYLHSDSYARSLKDTVFDGVFKLYAIDRNHGINYHLDSTRPNILIIEIVERYVRRYFSTLKMLDEVCDSVVKKKNISLLDEHMPVAKQYASVLSSFSISGLFNKYINQNLQCNLFNYNFMMPMFESKAALNYYVFNRASGDVVISRDKNYLLLKHTVIQEGNETSYVPVPGDELKKIIENFNTIYDHYRANGFKEVYLSIIPNTTTIIQPQGYNNLIPLIQNDPTLKMKVIDIYSVFKTTKADVFCHGDTHWNSTGRQMWIDLVNKTLSEQQKD